MALMATGLVLADGHLAALDMEAAARLALENQPQLAAQSAGIAALNENTVAARQLPDPKLRFGVTSLPTDTFDFTQEPMTQAVLGVSQTLPGGDKLGLAGQRLEREAESATLSLEASRRRIARDARLAWLDLYLPSTGLGLVDAIVAEYGRQVEWSEVAYKTGQMAQDETFALRTLEETARDRQAELVRQRQRALAGLARWLGEPQARRPLEALAEVSHPPDLEKLQMALDQHPELQALAGAAGVAQAEADQAREAYKPDWSVDLAYGLRGDDRPDFVSVVVGVDLPLFTANRQDRRLAARLAQVEQAGQRLADRKLALTAELQAAYADWQAADARVRRYEQDILPLAQRRVESALNTYGTGKAPYGRVLEAKRAELEVRLAWLNQQVARARAAVMLKYFSE
jgi:outer membrane protein TolC